MTRRAAERKEIDEDGSSKKLQLSRETTAADVTLFTLQRFAGVWHYYFYKKTALLMADDRLYHPSDRLPTMKRLEVTAELQT